MSDLKHLNLTERDFDMLVEGLDVLPEKGMAGELFGDLMISMLSKGDKEAENKMGIEREGRRMEKEAKRKEMRDDIKILQGKLLMLKRYLLEQGALDTTYEIINHIK